VLGHDLRQIRRDLRLLLLARWELQGASSAVAVGFRFRRSIRLGPGVRLNLSKSGIGVSTGIRGLHYSVHSSGRRTLSTGIPGTGMSYVTTLSRGRSRSTTTTRRNTAQRPVAIAARPKASLFAPGYEKEFARGVDFYLKGDLANARASFKSAAAKDSSNRVIADDLLSGVLEIQAGSPSDAIPYLEKVVAARTPLPDELIGKYLADSPEIELHVTSLVSASMPWSSLLAALALAEAYQAVGRIDEAVGVLRQLSSARTEPALTLSLCELLAERGAWAELNELAASISNEDDVSLQTKLFQAQALEKQGLGEAAISVYNECLRSRRRDPALLKTARYARGRQLLALGQRKRAARDLGLVYAEDPAYADVASLVRESTANVAAGASVP
jgi:tetratricopeptide (TPR) repeat protein